MKIEFLQQGEMCRLSVARSAVEDEHVVFEFGMDGANASVYARKGPPKPTPYGSEPSDKLIAGGQECTGPLAADGLLDRVQVAVVETDLIEDANELLWCVLHSECGAGPVARQAARVLDEALAVAKEGLVWAATLIDGRALMAYATEHDALEAGYRWDVAVFAEKLYGITDDPEYKVVRMPRKDFLEAIRSATESR